jgi:hypothetical protein
MLNWKSNNNIFYDSLVTRAISAISSKTSFNLYRMRTPLDVQTMNMVGITAAEAFDSTSYNDGINFKSLKQRWTIKSILRDEDEFIKAQMITLLTEATNIMYSYPIHYVVLNTAANASKAQLAIEAVKEFTDYTFTEVKVNPTALLNAFHKISMFKYIQDRVSIYVIVTNELTDEVILKIGGLIAEQKDKLELATAYYESDKAKFNTAFYNLFKNFIEEKAECVYQQELAKTVAYLSKVDTTIVDNEIARKLDDLRNYEQYVRDYLKRIQELRNQRLGMVEDFDASTVKYFKKYLATRRKDIKSYNHIVSGNKQYIQLILYTELLYWDESVMKVYEKASRSNMVTSKAPWLRNLLHAVLIDKTYTFLFETGIQINLTEAYAERWTIMNTMQDLTKGIQHPHIYHYNCFGDNKTPISKAILARDFIVAFEQIFATLSGINLTDSTVFEKFCSYLSRGEYPEKIAFIKEKATGRTLTLKQYEAEYLAAEKAKADAAKATVPTPDIPISVPVTPVVIDTTIPTDNTTA